MKGQDKTGWVGGASKIGARSILTQPKSHIPRPFTNKIGFKETSRTVAQLGEGGLHRWWVRGQRI
jgi:hypothetical protein